MKNYEDYIKGLKNTDFTADFGRMRTAIDSREKTAAVRARTAVSLSGAFAVLFLVSAVYLSSSLYFAGNQDDLKNYVFQNDNMNGNSVMSYVFGD